jgi:excisionase family DNA binding protein
MDAFLGLEAALRRVVADTVRQVLREELGSMLRNALAVAPAGQDHGDDRYISVKAAAQLVGVRTETIRSWLQAGSFPAYRAGRILRIRRAELESYLARKDDGPLKLDPEAMAREILARAAVVDATRCKSCRHVPLMHSTGRCRARGCSCRKLT